jgi:hypothetical protein
LIFPGRKASWAPQLETASAAWVPERSESPRRAFSSQEHRAPLYSIGACFQCHFWDRRKRFCFLFSEQKEVAP